MSHPDYRFYESLFCFRTMSGNFLGHADTAIILFWNQRFDFFTIRELSSHFMAFLIFENHFNFLTQNLKFGRLLSKFRIFFKTRLRVSVKFKYKE